MTEERTTAEKKASAKEDKKKTFHYEVNDDWFCPDLYNRWMVGIQMQDRIYGGIPKNPKLIEAWLKKNTEFNDEITDRQIAETIECLNPTPEKTLAEAVELNSVGFFNHPDLGLWIHSRGIKAMFKECAMMLRFNNSHLGYKQILQHGFEIKCANFKWGVTNKRPAYKLSDVIDGAEEDAPTWLPLTPSMMIPLGRKKPTGLEQKPIRISGPQGERSALKRIEYCVGVDIDFQVWQLKTDPHELRHVSEQEIKIMLTLGQENGLGADRSQGHGKYNMMIFRRMERGE